MNTTQETEFDYQTYMKESTQGPSKINRGTKAREKRREAVKARISPKLQQVEGTTMTYETQNFKIPNQSDDYSECSYFVTTAIEAIIKEAIEQGKNKISINTNLKITYSSSFL